MCEHPLDTRARAFTTNLKNTKLEVRYEPERARPPPTSGPTDRPTEPPPRTDPRSQGPGAPAREATKTSQAQPASHPRAPKPTPDPTHQPPTKRPTPPPQTRPPSKTPHQNAHPSRRSNPPTIRGLSMILHPRLRPGLLPIVGATGGWVPLDAEDRTPWWWPMFTGCRGVADVPTPLA